MKCAKCGEKITRVCLDVFDRNGADWSILHNISYEYEDTGAVVVDTTHEWTGLDLSEREQKETITCPKCGKFPFESDEIQVYNIVRIVCFNKEDEK